MPGTLSPGWQPERFWKPSHGLVNDGIGGNEGNGGKAKTELVYVNGKTRKAKKMKGIIVRYKKGDEK